MWTNYLKGIVAVSLVYTAPYGWAEQQGVEKLETSETAKISQSCFEAWRAAVQRPSSNFGLYNAAGLATSAGAVIGGRMLSQSASASASKFFSPLILVATTGALGLSATVYYLSEFTEEQKISLVQAYVNQTQARIGDMFYALSDMIRQQELDVEQIIRRVQSMDFYDESFGYAICTETNQPVILGRFFEMLLPGIELNVVAVDSVEALEAIE